MELLTKYLYHNEVLVVGLIHVDGAPTAGVAIQLVDEGSVVVNEIVVAIIELSDEDGVGVLAETVPLLKYHPAFTLIVLLLLFNASLTASIKVGEKVTLLKLTVLVSDSCVSSLSASIINFSL